MNDKEIAALADRIAEGRRGRKVMDFLAADTANLSEADSYKVQFAVHDRLTADGKDKMAGWKVALTLRSQYEPMKLSGPVFAGIYQSGVRPSGAVFEKGWPIKAGIECEMVARMSKDATAGGYTADSIKAHVASFHCGAEVVENRYADVTKVSLAPEPPTRALEVMHNVAASPAADPTLSTSQEDQARLAFEKGGSSFMVADLCTPGRYQCHNHALGTHVDTFSVGLGSGRSWKRR